MVDPVTTARIGYRSLYFGLAVVLLFLGLLPVSTRPVQWPGPDWLVALTVAWVLRRPDYVPALGIVAVFLVQDMLTMRAPGLWALIVLVGTEFLRSRMPLTRDLPFAIEWGMVAIVLAAMTIAQRLVLAALMVPQAGLGPSLIQLLATIACYPVVVFASHWALGLRKVAPGEVDALGHRV